MADLTQNHKTVLEFGDRKIDKGLSAEYFDVHYLERAR